MTETTFNCPKCNGEIRLTESLAAPLLESTRLAFEQKLAQKDAEASKREASMRMREEAIAKAKESVDSDVAEKLKIERVKLAAETAKRDAMMKTREEELARERAAMDEQVAAKMNAERARITAEESRKAKLATASDLEQRAKEVQDLKQIMEAQSEKLKTAQDAQTAALKKERELDEQKRELELTIEKRVTDSLTEVRDKARREAEDGLKLKVAEKDEQIASMNRKIEELQRKAEQGSQQLQGEAQELQLEALLSSKFPLDVIEPVPKGEHGGDILHHVNGPNGIRCGTILWEFKRTRNWSDGWLAKLRDDQRAAKADLAVIVSSAMPKGVEHFDETEGVWVTGTRTFLPVALSLRQRVVEVGCARQASEGQHTKMEMMYRYFTGQKFRQRVEAIVESFSAMQDDLLRERKVIMKQWDKRQTQIERAMQSTLGMYGDLQGIAGKTLQEIDGLDFKLLEGESESPTVES